MEPYNITFKSSVKKDLKRLDRKLVGRIIDSIASLADEPICRGAIKLSGSKFLYRIRVGEYRIVYQVDSPSREIVIHYVRHRREVYRAL
jgi:mRNA interferase RelE/StbE